MTEHHYFTKNDTGRRVVGKKDRRGTVVVVRPPGHRYKVGVRYDDGHFSWAAESDLRFEGEGGGACTASSAK